jgi:hypothetical protein
MTSLRAEATIENASPAIRRRRIEFNKRLQRTARCAAAEPERSAMGRRRALVARGQNTSIEGRNTMKRLGVAPMITGVAVLFLGVALLAVDAVGQEKALKEQLVGTWTIVSVDDVRPDGSRVSLFGPDPQGVLMFDANGRYSLQLCSVGRPKFASNNRLKGTPEENQAIVHGCNPHWGRYSVNEADRTILFQIDHAMYPNWEGTQQKRSFTLTGDELKYTVPTPTIAGANPVVVWKRAK